MAAIIAVTLFFTFVNIISIVYPLAGFVKP